MQVLSGSGQGTRGKFRRYSIVGHDERGEYDGEEPPGEKGR